MQLTLVAKHKPFIPYLNFTFVQCSVPTSNRHTVYSSQRLHVRLTQPIHILAISVEFIAFNWNFANTKVDAAIRILSLLISSFIFYLILLTLMKSISIWQLQRYDSLVMINGLCIVCYDLFECKIYILRRIYVLFFLNGWATEIALLKKETFFIWLMNGMTVQMTYWAHNAICKRFEPRKSSQIQNFSIVELIDRLIFCVRVSQNKD